ncbi:hypothetical protein HOB87_04175 [Candidatus Woesearchaeota archaeon]|jgi:hypothetical protein|nr:hypothetical protein [Candidatus Woesearchaeota archaeon]MBT5759047.1 hypothetical protein [Candidatus Neomarinimicrobiota bacterium]MBT7557379.1 hypothetical protein [Candidatus Woesearchaeota archaeon]
MHYFEFSEKDTTLYEQSHSMNTGLDEILEIRKDMNVAGTQIYVSRALVKFDLTYISQSVSSGLITSGSSTKFYLNLFDANSSALNVDQTLYSYPVSQSWENGSGRYNLSPIVEDGAGWKWKDNGITRTQWNTVSGSGGTWYSGSGYEASQSFTNEPADVRMDVTDIMWKWLHSTVSNEGFMVKRSGSIGNIDSDVEEGNTTRYGNFSFFSRETHTIYPPKLEVVWDDSKWVTGSLTALSSANLEDVQIYMRGFREKYKENSKVKFRVVGREMFPERSYSSTQYTTGYNTVKTLPSGSTYYQIKDAYTDDVIVPFGSGSVVSCDSTGNYFNFWMNGLQSERFYRINYKIVSGSGTADETVQYFDEKNSFKVER